MHAALPAGHWFSTTVTEPLRVHAALPAGHWFSTTVTDDSGEYTLYGIPDGSLLVGVDGKGYVEQQRNVTVRDGNDLTGLDF